MAAWLAVLIFALTVRLLALATSGRGTATDSSILQFVLGKAAYTAPVGSYAALFSATPTADNGTFTELTGNAYARALIDVANAAAAWSSTTTDATGVWKTNAAAITFPTATPSAWTAATGFGIYDQSTTGILLYWGTFGGPSTVGIGATASFAIGALKVTEA
jgi:hypothetical protein